ncbi:hypothetical protein LDENG_00056230 [Lucifuga dentata]|nr:hypothetical protein LDENG_00056230 [Lucifuga dentata]
MWKAPSGHEPKVKRGIMEECCHKPCSIYHLEGFCDWLATPQLEPLTACKKHPEVNFWPNICWLCLIK